MQKIVTESLQGYGGWLKEALLRTGLTIKNCADACHCSNTFVYQTFKELDRLSTVDEVLSCLVIKTIMIESDSPRYFIYFLIRWMKYAEKMRQFERTSGRDFRDVVRFLYESIEMESSNLDLILAATGPSVRSGILAAFPVLGTSILRALDGSEEATKRLIEKLGYQNKGVMHLMRQLQKYRQRLTSTRSYHA